LGVGGSPVPEELAEAQELDDVEANPSSGKKGAFGYQT
jgi:hypothetical protein